MAVKERLPVPTPHPSVTSFRLSFLPSPPIHPQRTLCPPIRLPTPGCCLLSLSPILPPPHSLFQHSCAQFGSGLRGLGPATLTQSDVGSEEGRPEASRTQRRPELSQAPCGPRRAQ